MYESPGRTLNAHQFEDLKSTARAYGVSEEIFCNLDTLRQVRREGTLKVTVELSGIYGRVGANRSSVKMY